MTLDKPSKWSSWKSKFYVVSSPSPQLNRWLRRYNKHPAFLGRKCALPTVPSEAWDKIMQKGLFKKTTSRLDDGSEIIVPQFWVPHPDWFKDEAFLSACNLSTMFPKKVATEKLPKEKTPATSAALLRKEQIEKKKSQLAAKDDGAGNKGVPRSLSKMVKRPAGDIPLPAAKVLKMPVPPSAKTIPKPPAGGRPTTGGKSLSGIVPTIEVVDEGVKESVTLAGQTQTGTGSNAAGGDSTPQSDKGMTLAFDPPWPLGPMRVKTQACQSGDSSGSRQNIGEAYAQHLIDKSLIADATSSRPNYQQYAKRMIRTLTRTEKEAVPAVHTVNIDRITSLLAESSRLISQVMLRVDGLQVPLRKKQEEVRDAQRRASELIDVSQYNAIRYDLETKRRELEQEELLKQTIAAAEAKKARADGLALKVNDLQADLKALEGADKENADLRADINRLKNELASSQAAHKEKLKKEQSRLIAENETDNVERVKLAWGLIHPDYDYEFFDLRYKYASEVYDAEVLGLDPPAPFEEWAGLVKEEQQEGEQATQTQQQAQEQVQEQQQPEQQPEQQQQQEHQ
ncbi:uncharacterized protein LOC110684884 [Chenopodium quinoa]|uniref:uncharacterized protein LOC110684884 n=1 Tax=Chenopodium quinoa TaxID=63459 RepID=UPI000B781BC6|nr:uncharacterized protein LOC110684884 [Chenopodium quinoa]